MLRTVLLTLSLASLGTAAHAAAFEPKTMRATLPARELERPLILGKGWLELGLGVDYKMADGYWDSDGVAQDFESARFLYTTQRADIRYGVSNRGELFWSFKTHYIELTNDTLGTDTVGMGIGDPSFGYKFEVFRGLAPASSVIVSGKYKAPAGNESPGNYVGGANTFSSFVMTTGTPDVTLGVRAKRAFGPVAVEAGLGYVHRFSGVVMYVVELEENQFSGRIKPGDQLLGDAGLLLQLGPVAVQAAGVYTHRNPTQLGTASAGLTGDRNLVAVSDSDGWSLDVNPGVIISASRGVDVNLGASIPVRGEDLQFFPIEDLSPTRGMTLSGTLELRY